MHPMPRCKRLSAMPGPGRRRENAIESNIAVERTARPLPLCKFGNVEDPPCNKLAEPASGLGDAGEQLALVSDRVVRKLP